MTRFPGLGHRLSEQLRTLGFWKDGHPDVGRFCREKGYRPQYVYAWLKDRMPAYHNIQRLCTDLGVTVIWLVAGEAAHASAQTASSSNGADGARTAHRRRRHPGHGGVATTPAPVFFPVDLARLHEATNHVASLQADLRALMAAFPDPCWWIDDVGRVIDVNGTADEATRVAAVGRTVREVFPSDTAVVLQRGLTEALRSNEVVAVEYVLSGGAPRRSRTYEARIRPVVERPGGRARRALVVIRDITERRAREEEYRELLEGSSNGLCIYRNFIVQYANRGLARMLGYGSPAELVGRDVREFVPDAPAHRETPSRSVPIDRRGDAQAVLRDGRRIPVIALGRHVMWRSEVASLLTVMPHPRPRRA